MSNELPQPPTEMCEPVITGSNELHKAIDEYWQSKYPKYATGRIKRMRAKEVYPFVDLTKRTRKKYTDCFPRCYATITRWNRH
jgi:hypothetical protein